MARNKENHKLYMREYSRKNAETINKQRRERRKAFNDSLFVGKKCLHCGATNDLLYHHRDPSTKLGTITRIAKKLLEAEIAKCDVLCRPCHTFLHRFKYLDRAAYREYRLEFMKQWHRDNPNH